MLSQLCFVQWKLHGFHCLMEKITHYSDWSKQECSILIGYNKKALFLLVKTRACLIKQQLKHTKPISSGKHRIHYKRWQSQLLNLTNKSHQYDLHAKTRTTFYSYVRSKLCSKWQAWGQRSPGVKIGDVDISVGSGLSLAPK